MLLGAPRRGGTGLVPIFAFSRGGGWAVPFRAVAEGTDTFTYAYLADSDLVNTVSGPASMVQTRAYETTRDLVDYVENKIGATTVSKYDYTNDTIGRRTGVQKSGTAFTTTDTIAWGYDNRSQVTSAVAATDATYDYTYAYDPIGNRTSSVTKETGTPVTTGYTSSQLNQYTAITSRTDPTYDDDGNMTLLPAAAGDWTLAWDGENRLASAESATKRLEFVYDHMDRRIERRTYEGAPGDWTLAETRRFLYDGWHLVAEFDHQSGVNTLKCTHLWGLDLSQSVGGAGGVGGLLRTTLYPTSPIGGGWAQGQRYYPTYDGNGNVSEYLDAAAAIAARHQYSPFGRLTVSTGLALPFRFSTKYLDADTSLYYYGYRYYTPELGRWLSRDPIGERGGRNLHRFIANSPVARTDYLGLFAGTPRQFPEGHPARKYAVDKGISINCPCRCAVAEGPAYNRDTRKGKKDGDGLVKWMAVQFTAKFQEPDLSGLPNSPGGFVPNGTYNNPGCCEVRQYIAFYVNGDRNRYNRIVGPHPGWEGDLTKYTGMNTKEEFMEYKLIEDRSLGKDGRLYGYRRLGVHSDGDSIADYASYTEFSTTDKVRNPLSGSTHRPFRMYLMNTIVYDICNMRTVEKVSEIHPIPAQSGTKQDYILLNWRSGESSEFPQDQLRQLTRWPAD